MEFIFHQALFGYDGGHQLLAASLPLSTQTTYFLAVATDLSGSAPLNGFDQCFTGLPVPETNFYALFSTWLAPEMSRPGCVWSHVLLIALADIAELRDLGKLRKQFLRPSRTPQLEPFLRPLRYDDTLEGPYGEVPLSHEQLAAKLLTALYRESEKSVVLPAVKASARDDEAFAVWSQQWPRLRRNFRFSTGSFADRGRRGTAFDLQVTPESNLSVWDRKRLLVVDDRDTRRAGPLGRREESWLQSAVEDLLHPDLHGFRNFLRTYGADVNALRAAFIPLASQQSLLDRPQARPWIDALRNLATDFPAPDEAGTLKTASVSVKSPLLSEDEKLQRLIDTISFLCHEDTTRAFERISFDFTTAIVELWSTRRDDVVATLAKPPLFENRWRALAKAVAGIINASEIAWLCGIHPEMVVPVIRLNPDLAAAVSVWQLPERSQWSVIEALESSVVSDELWRDITHSMLMAGTLVGAREVTHRAGVAALDGALQWLVDAQSVDLPPPLWREVLRPLAEQRLATSTLSPLELAFCAVIAPSAAQMSIERADLQTLASEPLEKLPPSLRLPTAFFMVTFGLQNSEHIGGLLLARGMFSVYEALATATEPPEAWRLLQPYLPTLWYWQEWDRCEKLRRALSNWLRENPGALKTILAAARKPAEKELVESLR